MQKSFCSETSTVYVTSVDRAQPNLTLLQTPFLASLGPYLTLVSLTGPVPDPCMWAEPAWFHPVPRDTPRAGAASVPPAALPLAEVVGMAQAAKSCPFLLPWAVPAVPKPQRAAVP